MLSQNDHVSPSSETQIYIPGPECLIQGYHRTTLGLLPSCTIKQFWNQNLLHIYPPSQPQNEPQQRPRHHRVLVQIPPSHLHHHTEISSNHTPYRRSAHIRPTLLDNKSPQCFMRHIQTLGTARNTQEVSYNSGQYSGPVPQR